MARIKTASDALGAVGDFIKDHPTLLSALVGGGLGAYGGWSRTEEKPGEPAKDRMKRRIQNALILGGIGAAGGGLLSEGIQYINKPLPKDGVVDKVLGAGTDVVANPAVLGGTATLAADRQLSRWGLTNRDLVTAGKEISNNILKQRVLKEDGLLASEARRRIIQGLNDPSTRGQVLDYLKNKLFSSTNIKDEKLYKALNKFGIGVSDLNYNLLTGMYGQNAMSRGAKVLETISKYKGPAAKFAIGGALATLLYNAINK